MDLTAHWVGITAVLVFVIAYGLVIAEEFTHLRKSVPVIFGAGVIWAVIAQQYVGGGMDHAAEEAVEEFLVEFAQLFLFLLAAMTYVNSMSERAIAQYREGERLPFCLVFAGPKDVVLPQKIYRIQHPKAGTMDIFLVPIGPDEGNMLYEAVFA